MCGIGGIFRKDGLSALESDLKRMNVILSHRGPDGEGIYRDNVLGFCHTRLSILDLSDRGGQPMSYRNQRYWLTYNGEIFNFIELKRELELRGHIFFSDTDSEVLLAAYAEWGPACLDRFNGMWAFAIWDSKERRLFLSRDNFGIKPLYYYEDQKIFAFASEIKGFLGIECINLNLTPDGLATGIEYSNVIDGMAITPFENVFKLLPGHYMILEEGRLPAIVRWWKTLDHLPPVHPLPLKQNEHLQELLFDSCRLRLRSDVPVGTCLSGGIDSSSIFGVINKIKTDENARTQKEITPFIVRFSGIGHAEQDMGENFARDLGIQPVVIDISAEDAFDPIEEIVFSFEDVAGFNLAQWLLYKRVRERGVSVSLDGHGGDECFGGYPLNIRYRAVEITNALIFTAELIEKMEGDSGRWPLLVRKRRVPDLSGLTLNNSFQLNKANFDTDDLKGKPAKYYSPIWEEDLPQIEEMGLSFKILYFQGHGGFLQWNLRTYDMVSMAHAVEVRLPFLDWRVYCYCLALPTERRIGKGFSKLALREAMRGIVPRDILENKRKIGFSSPLRSWFSGTHNSFLREIVYSHSFLSSELWDGDLVAEKLEGGNLHLTVWPYVQAHLLNERFKKTRKKVFENIPS